MGGGGMEKDDVSGGLVCEEGELKGGLGGEEERCLGGGLEVRGRERGGWCDERVWTTKQRRESG